jgi:hypothetical protein
MPPSLLNGLRVCWMSIGFTGGSPQDYGIP